MRDVVFYGASDDLFECEDPGGKFVEEIGCYNSGAAYIIEDFGNEAMVVYARYAPEEHPGGCWVIGLSMRDEDSPFPEWPVKYAAHKNGYSPRLTVTVPDTAKVRVLSAPA